VRIEEAQDRGHLGEVEFLGGIRTKERASQTSVFVRTWGAVGTAAVAEGHFPADLPRVFRTADLWLIHAAACCSRYSS